MHESTQIIIERILLAVFVISASGAILTMHGFLTGLACISGAALGLVMWTKGSKQP